MFKMEDGKIAVQERKNGVRGHSSSGRHGGAEHADSRELVDTSSQSDGSISHRSSAARGRDKDSGLERESCITAAMVCTVHVEYIESRT